MKLIIIIWDTLLASLIIFSYYRISLSRISLYVTITNLPNTFRQRSGGDFISAAQRNLIRGPWSGSKNTVAGSSWSASRARGASLTGAIEACLSPFVDNVSRALWPWPRSVAVVRVSLDDSLALARIVLLPRPKCARVASRACSSSRRPSTMRGVSLWGLRFTASADHWVPLCYPSPSRPPLI